MDVIEPGDPINSIRTVNPERNAAYVTLDQGGVAVKSFQLGCQMQVAH
jgi:hypothetical protein